MNLDSERRFNRQSERQHMNMTNLFDGRAINYTVSRPSYSIELINYLYSQYGISEASVVADIGSGTGKFSKHLLDRQNEVYCVEPNDEMRSIAENELCKYNNFHSVAGDAENTTLKNNFVDCITAAQAFHWFDVLKFKKECLRIIKPNGRVFLIWNIRDANNIINQEWHNIFSQFCYDFKGFSNGIERDDIKIKAFFDKGYEYITFDYPLIFDKENFIKRSLSSSYSLKDDDVNYGAYISALNEIFYKYENNGLISISNQSVAYIGFIK